jgi:D-glycero-D-manno-heptose 1,7-bisphosphate phosphatase
MGAKEQPCRPAVFLDRDGTLIEHVHHLTDPEAVRVLPGTADALNRLRRAGYACVVVTNQSVLGRGLVTKQRLQEIHREMLRQLAQDGATLDGIYYCPTIPWTTDRAVVEDEDRKPGAGMLKRAAADLGLDLADSWMIGDAVSDVLAGVNAGCRGSLWIAGEEQSLPPGCAGSSTRIHQVPDLAAAVHLVLEGEDPE